MACELHIQKRPCDEVISSSKRQCLDTSLSEKELNIQSLTYSTNDLLLTDMLKPTITQDFSTNATHDDTAIFEDISNDFHSPKDYLNAFCDDLKKSDFTNNLPLLNEQLIESRSAISHADDKISNISPTYTCETINISSYSNDLKLRNKNLNSFVFQKDLGDLIFLALKLHNRQYYVHIREFKRNLKSGEEIATKNGIVMDINTWYEFQYKLIAFNLRYKSTSFIANNYLLVFNYNHSTLHIKKIKNSSHIELNNQQLGNLKEITQNLNEELLHHMYRKQLPYLIKRKCISGNISTEKELKIMTKLIFAIEQNMTSILKKIYECVGCSQHLTSKNLHSCRTFTKREQFQHLGNTLLMLIDLDFVSSVFLNSVHCVNENFLCNINEHAIANVLFQNK